MAHYVVCYDIANPKRLQRIHRRAVAHAQFVQYSIYYLDGSRQQLQNMLDEIADEIDEKEDDVRAYSIHPISEAICLGKPLIPEEIYLV